MPRRLLDNLNAGFVIILFICVSLIPEPLLGSRSNVIKIFLFLAFVDLWTRKGNAVFRLNSLPMWFFIISTGLSIIPAVNKEIAILKYLDIALPLIFIYYIVSENFFCISNFNFFVRIISICSILVSLLGIMESIFGFNPIYEYFIKSPYYKRTLHGFLMPVSTQTHPKVLATYLVACLPFNFLLFKQGKSYFKQIGLVGTFLCSILIIFTFSQMALLAVIAMTVFYLFIQKNCIALRLFLCGLLVSGFIASFLAYPFKIFSIEHLILGKGFVFSVGNFMKFLFALDIIKQHPFFGLGFKNGNSSLDNIYATFLASSGIIGFLGFSVFIIYIIKSGLAEVRRLGYDSQKRLFLLITLVSFIGLIIDVSGYDFIYWPSPYLYFCILAGCMNALSGMEEERS